MTDTLFSLLLFTLFAAGACATGGLITGRLRSWRDGAEQATFATALGMGIIAYLVLLLGLVGLFHVFAFRVLLIAIPAFSLAYRLLIIRGKTVKET